MRLIVLCVAVAALAACSDQAPSAGRAGQVPAPPESRADRPSEPDEPSVLQPGDACGAAEQESLVGRSRSELPAAPAGANWRIFETGQPVTQDLRPDRLNIEIAPDAQTVVRLSCG